MKRTNIAWVGLLGMVAGLSLAQAKEPGNAPRLEFRTIPIEGADSSVHSVTPYRIYDRVVVTVSDPVACGQKPKDPAMAIEGNRLSLSYKLTPASPVAKACTLISEFVVLNAPKRDLEVSFAGGPEPYVVARMRKCPFYEPKTADIWECLAPDAN